MGLAFSRIGLTGKPGASAAKQTLQMLARHLRERGVDVRFERGVVDGVDEASMDASSLAGSVDLVICVGGDGTLLHAARHYALAGLPLVGVNIGRLGFLVDVSPEEALTRLDELLEGQFIEEHRLLLDMAAYVGERELGRGIAFNDVVLHKGDVSRMLDFATLVDSVGVSDHRADGLIVATPTGSTAYALSGGGPILHPALDAVVMVPICPHTLSDRPLVVPGLHRITLTTGGKTGDALVTCDGQPGIRLPPGAHVAIRRSARSVRLLHPADYDFFAILRDKLHWGREPGTGGSVD